MVKGSSSEALVVIGDGSGFGIGGVGGELQELHAQFLIRRYSLRFEDQNTSNEPNQNNDCKYSSTCDVACTHGTWILGSRARILVLIT